MLPPLTAIPPDIVTPDDYRRYAAERMSPEAHAFLEGGAADEITLRRNREAFDRIFLNTRVLSRVAGGHTRLNLFGRDLAHPFVLAPIAYQRLAHPGGEIAVARAAAAFGACYTVAMLSSISVEEIAAAAPDAPRWFQLYFRRDRDFTLALVERARKAGCEAIVVTVDSLFAGVRHRARRAGYSRPDDVTCVHLADEPKSAKIDIPEDGSVVFDGVMALAPTWNDLRWLRTHTSLPILIKGITGPEDALRALDVGADGIVVSNHGGRALDSMPAGIEMLPRVAEAIGGRIPVLLDGGVSRGNDALKALALGADAVMIGRPYMRALASAGALGVAHTLKMLREELEAAMAMTGCRTLEDIGPQVIFRS